MNGDRQAQSGPAQPSRSLHCPSAQPDMEGVQVFGVVLGTAARPQVAYMARTTTIGELAPSLGAEDPGRVLRLAARCEEARCAHHVDDQCSLGQRIVASLPSVVDVLPRCAIRSTCRWYAEQGGSACMRCPQVITRDEARPGNEALAQAARRPDTPAGQG